MLMRSSSLVALLLLPLAAVAGEKVSGTNFYVVDQPTWKTGEGSGYFMWHGEGISQSAEGPLPTSAIECHGAGFWGPDGSSGEGICVIGAEDDTRIMHWKRDMGEKFGRWEMLMGTGKFAGITGEGTYTSERLPGGRYMSQWEGEVTLPE